MARRVGVVDVDGCSLRRVARARQGLEALRSPAPLTNFPFELLIRHGLEQATERIVEATAPIAALPPAPFEEMTGKQWKAIAAIVESTRGTCGGPRTDLRLTVDRIRWVLHHGAKWRDVPAKYGKPTTVWRWYERWCGDGTWQQIAAALALAPTEVGREPSRRPATARSRRRAPIDVDAVETPGST